MNKKILQKYRLDLILFFLTFIIIIPVILPCLHSGLFKTYDDIFVNRLEEMAYELKTFQFPVRFNSQLGRGAGYMLFNFYGPLPYYWGGFLILIGFSSIQAAKLAFITGFLLAYLFVFLTIRIIFNLKSAVFGTIYFMYFPYLGFDVYKRGDLGEFWAMAIFPLCILFCYLLLLKKKRYLFFLSTISLALIFLTHTLSTYLYLPFFLIFLILLSNFKKGNIRLLLKSYFLSLLISSFFWAVILAEKSGVWVWYLHKNLNFYRQTFLRFNDLIAINNGGFYIINLLTLILPLISLIFVKKYLKKSWLVKPIYLIGVLVFFGATFLSLESSSFIWSKFSFLLSIMQTPWRLLTLTPFFGAFIFSSYFYFFKNGKWVIFLLLFLLTAYVFINFNNFQPKTYEYVSKYLIEDSCGTTGDGYEYFPITIKACFRQYPKEREISVLYGDGNLNNIKKGSRYFSANIKTTEKSLVSLQRYYYPGWEVFIDGKKTPINYENLYGIITFWVEKGNHEILVKFEETPLRLTLNLLSFFSFIFLILVSISKKIQKFFLPELSEAV